MDDFDRYLEASLARLLDPLRRPSEFTRGLFARNFTRVNALDSLRGEGGPDLANDHVRGVVDVARGEAQEPDARV